MLLDFLLFLEAILAGVLSILIVLAFERNKKPHLSFKVGESGEIFDHDALVRPASKWLKVEIHNDNLTGLFSFIYDREPAFMCRASITFMNLDRTSVFGRIMPTR